MEGGVTITAGDLDPATLKGGANTTETVPVIEQVAFRPLSSSIHGGVPAYVMLRVKNTGGRAPEDGYVTIRFISKDGTFSYKGGTAHLPTIYPGEERDVPLIIKTQRAGEKKTGNTLYCSEYLLDGSINELMEGGISRRGENCRCHVRHLLMFPGVVRSLIVEPRSEDAGVHKGYKIRTVHERTGGLMRRSGRYPVGSVTPGLR